MRGTFDGRWRPSALRPGRWAPVAGRSSASLCAADRSIGCSRRIGWPAVGAGRRAESVGLFWRGRPLRGRCRRSRPMSPRSPLLQSSRLGASLCSWLVGRLGSAFGECGECDEARRCADHVLFDD
ncbi:hypothetical protein BpHYR1_044445 [Brachionus plicatilis]|uniref:Uncharacterized protein n=1 Tax=Brachionus plicatilis TaxID=10195 RepID=A0A3M7QRR3_BRAPC|nr:hypothetical protein BpHYR1_044445 [Brachionus plicatilis]